MATVVMFHHALGLTAALRDYADVLRSFGHDVRTPDLFDGHTFADVHLGVSFAESMGFDTMVQKAEAAVSVLPPDVVYIGFSLGVLPAQHLAHVRAGALGAVFLYACAPESMFGQPLPSSLPIQIHGNEFDPFFVHDGDLDNARAIVDSHPEAELYLYPGKGHLFAETDHPDFEADSAMQARGRIASFLASVS
jgi:dienelactone hydrolase